VGKATDDRIRRWIPAIEEIREDQGLTAKQYPNWVILTLISIESKGDQDAHSIRNGKPSQYYGLLQIGVANAKDVGRRNTDHDGDGHLSIDSFLRYAERYARGPTRHNYDPEKISILWKSGPGTLKRYIQTQNNLGQQAGEQYLSERFGGSSLAYLNKFRRLAKKWSDGKAQVADPTLVLPSSSRRQYNAPSASGLPDCPPKAGSPQILVPSQSAAQAAQATAQEALSITQQGGATGFKTDPADPAAASGSRTRTIRVLRQGRFETLTAEFPSEVDRVSYSLPLAAIAVVKGFGTPSGFEGEFFEGVEYDTAGDPNQFVHAVARGQVVSVTVTKERGNVVTINHEGFLVSSYGHLGEVLVSTGDSVLPGDVIARAGQTKGAFDEVFQEFLAISRARQDPVLYFELRGDASLLFDGETSENANISTRPVPIDPSGILRTAPAPGEVRAVTKAETKKLNEARESYASLALTASTPNAQTSAQTAYDMSVALSRADQIASLPRSAYTSQEDSQRQVRTAFGNTALALDGSEF